MKIDNYCNGTGKEFKQWILYKKEKALKFVEQGYSVEWVPDGESWIMVYIPERDKPEIRAIVNFFYKPSKYGINNGKISRLDIRTRHVDLTDRIQGRPYESTEILFGYDREKILDKLYENPEARQLYDIIIEELN